MLDIKFIRENKEIVQEGAKKKRVDIDITKLIALDDERLKILKEVEELRSEVNKVSNDIVRNQDSALKIQLIEEMRVVKEDIKSKEEKLKTIMEEWQKMMLSVPNVPDISVPEGSSDAENKEVKVGGEKPIFNFEIKNQLTLISDLDLADFERGTKVAGFRGYFLKNEGALLAFALWQFFFDSLVSKGFIPMIVPSLVKKASLVGTGYIPGGEDDLYKTQDGDYLAGTGEVATMSYYSNEVLDKTKFPIKFAAFSTCFRREAGSHGKDVKGFFRVHEFYKLEQVVLCEANHEESVKFHEEITKNVEDLLIALNLPYHIVANCGGDLGLGQVKKYDIEVWMPSQNKYRETHSASYFHDFQTRRLNIRYKDADGKLKYAHSLNNTAVATPRIIEAIVENFQQADGSVKIPEVLRKYMGNREFIK
ncbi:serine--tRNA ligase [Candidatus Nomurabacteria bacterium RIFOXYC2_FULL_36_19]|uniref:Serine--tRNA ligase n=2 Tax=Candidatus Nomuraibacteriota TaxID=1752729 RepID=A0A1F6YWL9_9BACT|nr:MAG: Serine-tRNA ligase [Candidatus Nomurabacteria bacterium GW2011_GWC2_35_8]OGJ06171.1 MAG: serine--tRNA ligase [Candidatus Nomurabacteria bacterium RIFOXYA2_FULL_35_9]OGJ10733.1 MAG: serine--tRNA ligase [Candidatus Nomurabacteria bacterium RIFOXYC2_FULL_36_19]OGJ13926.1 MAG: serine--tRNA ligase [Candidatus Nomurabacteria bacterium RIFOXYD2_FULL_35_12]